MLLSDETLFYFLNKKMNNVLFISKMRKLIYLDFDGWFYSAIE